MSNIFSLFCSCGVGDKLVITEQSLDQQCFFVINMRSESEGKVPVEFVKVGEFSRPAIISLHPVHV